MINTKTRCVPCTPPPATPHVDLGQFRPTRLPLSVLGVHALSINSGRAGWRAPRSRFTTRTAMADAHQKELVVIEARVADMVAHVPRRHEEHRGHARDSPQHLDQQHAVMQHILKITVQKHRYNTPSFSTTSLVSCTKSPTSSRAAETPTAAFAPPDTGHTPTSVTTWAMVLMQFPLLCA
jgi:hypothetical protein